MPAESSQGNAWRRLVLDGLPKPAWQVMPGLHTEVVLSTRVRFMRNLAGRRFVHHATTDELREVAAAVAQASPSWNGSPLELQQSLSPTERDYLVACRLASVDFEWAEPGRALYLDRTRLLSLMVNEEDHLRLQAVTSGWSVGVAERAAGEVLSGMGDRLAFAWSPKFGYLSASPYNCGAGERVSALFHLIGLAHLKRLPKVLSALAGRGIVSRGLFGESSRALGAFAQVSVTSGPKEAFLGAGKYLLEEEQEARAEVGSEVVRAKTLDALKLVSLSRSLSLPDSLRVLAWVRWAASAGLEPIAIDPRRVDAWFTNLILRTSGDEARAARARASFLREELGL